MNSTYKAALIQTQGYQTLRSHVIKILSSYDLTTVEWTILGHIFYQGDLRFIDIAKLLKVAAPHVTNLIDGLETKGLVDRKDDKKDRRTKRITLTPKGQIHVPIIEKQLEQSLQELLQGISEREMKTYFKVLETIIKNDQIITKGGENK